MTQNSQSVCFVLTVPILSKSFNGLMLLLAVNIGPMETRRSSAAAHLSIPSTIDSRNGGSKYGANANVIATGSDKRRLVDPEEPPTELK